MAHRGEVPTASSPAVRSSQEMKGASIPSVKPLTSTMGSGRAVSLPVALRVAGGVGVQARHEDDPGDLPVEQHLDVFVLGHAAGRLGAQDRCEPVLRER
jgi:hypothetical protein